MSVINKPLRILLAADFAVLIAVAMLTPFYSLYVSKIGGNILEAGAAASVFAVTAGLASIAAGRYAEDIKRKELLIGVCFILIGLGFLSYIFVHAIWQLVLVQVFVGLVSAWYQPAYDALYTAHTGTKRVASLQWSLWEASNYFSIAIGALVGAYIVNYWGFTVLFASMASLSVLSGIYLLTLPKRVI
jgi:MFS family permease